MSKNKFFSKILIIFYLFLSLFSIFIYPNYYYQNFNSIKFLKEKNIDYKNNIIEDIKNFKLLNNQNQIKFHIKNSDKGLEEWIANSGAAYQKWLLKEYDAFNGINNLDINWLNLKKEVNKLNIEYYGNNDFKNIFFFNKIKSETKINLDESLKGHKDLMYSYLWETNVSGDLIQNKNTLNQLGGWYLISNLSSNTSAKNNLFNRHCIGDISGLHTHDGNWAMAGSHHNYQLKKSIYNTEVFLNQKLNLDIYNMNNVENIINVFTEWNFPIIKNPNNLSGIWNLSDLNNFKYNSILKFSNNFILLWEINQIYKILYKINLFYIKNNYIKYENKTKFFLSQLNNNSNRWKNLINELKNNNILNPNINYFSFEEIIILYNRLIAFFSSNKIFANINNKNYLLWDGDNFASKFDFYLNSDNKNNYLLLNIKKLFIENTNLKFGVINPNVNLDVNEKYKNLLLKYRSNFNEINNIPILENNILNFINIYGIDKNILELIWTDKNKISHISFENKIKIQNELNKNFSNIFEEIDLFNYKNDILKFSNLDSLLKDFNLFENRYNININPLFKDNLSSSDGFLNKNNGIVYFIAKINNWKSINKLEDEYDGNFLINAKINFINEINKNNKIIGELFNKDLSDNSGYFFIKLSINPIYLKNAKDFLLILENYYKIFDENYIIKNKNNFFQNIRESNLSISINNNFYNDKKNWHIFYDLSSENKFIKKHVWNEIEKNISNIFDYKKIIFNEENIIYQKEIDFIEKKIKDHQLVIFENIKEKSKTIKSNNYLNISLVTIFSIIIIILLIFIFYLYKNKQNKKN